MIRSTVNPRSVTYRARLASPDAGSAVSVTANGSRSQRWDGGGCREPGVMATFQDTVNRGGALPCAIDALTNSGASARCRAR